MGLFQGRLVMVVKAGARQAGKLEWEQKRGGKLSQDSARLSFCKCLIISVATSDLESETGC
jgi:hypothetical protein